MTPISDDEFDDLYDYDESLEAEIQRLENEMAARPTTVREKETVTVAYETERQQTGGIVKDEVDAPELALSQNSAFEEELVDQVTSLLHPESVEESQQANSEPDIKIIPISVDEHGNLLEAVQIAKDDRSLFQRFRKREFFSVSDLVGPLWCEVQYDYRLRSKPYLKPEDRPDIIVSREGKQIPLNKVKAGDHEKIMKRGEVVHKKLEKEIHPVEVKATTTTREDVWGLRFLNMLSSLQALLDIGKCRELPVVGFVCGFLVVGVIDELVLEKVATPENVQNSSPERKSQRLLTSFFASNPQSKARRSSKRTHRLLVSDSKTRASGTLPRLETARSGMMQLMCYKEILDGMLAASNQRHTTGKSSQDAGPPMNGDPVSGSQSYPISIDEDSGVASEQVGGETSQRHADADSAPQIGLSISENQPFEEFSWSLLFRHLHLEPTATLSEDFLIESRSVIHGNGLEQRLFDGKCLWDYVDCWVDLVKRLGLGQAGIGTEGNCGRSEDRLELVYRNVRTTSTKVDHKRKSRRVKGEGQQTSSSVLTDEPMHMVGSTADQLQATEEERLLALAIEESLKDMPAETSVDAGFAEIEGLQDTLSPPRVGSDPNQAQTPLLKVSPDSQAEVVQNPGDPMASRSSLSHAGETGKVAQTGFEISEGGIDLEPPTTTQSTEVAPSKPGKKSKRKRPKDGSIIGSHVFTHDRVLLAKSLESVLHFWMGVRQPEGVGIENVSRCGWCEFEEGCEWRDMKAKQAAAKNKAQMKRE